MQGAFKTADVDITSDANAGPRVDVMSMLRRNARTIIILTIIGAVCAGFLARNLEPQYSALATLVLERSDTRLSQAVASLEQQDLDRSAVETEIDIILSRSFAGEAVDAFDLVNNAHFNPYLAPRDGLLAKFGRMFEAPAETTDESAQEPLPAEYLPPVHEQRDRTISRLLDAMSVARAGQESLAMHLRVNGPDPIEAAWLANGIAKLYVDRSLERTRKATLETIAFLQKRADELAASISATEVEIASYGARNNVADSDKVDLLSSQMIDLNAQLTKARVELAEAEARLRQLKNVSAEGAGGLSDILTSPLLDSLRSDRARLQRERDELAQVYAEQHPQLQTKLAEVRSIDTLINEETNRIVIELENQAELAKARVSQLRSDLNGLEQRSRDRELSQIELRQLERLVSGKRARHEEILSRLSALERQVQVLTPSARLVSEAETPVKPFFPRPVHIVVGGGVGSLVLAVILVLLIEGFDSRVRSGFALERRLGFANLGYIPLLPAGSDKNKKKRASMFSFVKERPQSHMDEAIRSILWRCCIGARREGNRIILISSALPGEGKTSVASALAAVSASLGRQTVLIDFDLRRHGATHMTASPKQRSLFGRKPEESTAPSVQDYLAGDLMLDDILTVDPDQPNLTILSSNRKMLESNAVFYSQRLSSLFAELDARFDVTIVDTPPALLVNEAIELSEFADFVVLVARWGKTKQAEITMAASLFRSRSKTRMGLVVNGVRHDRQKLYEVRGFEIDYAAHAKTYYRT